MNTQRVMRAVALAALPTLASIVAGLDVNAQHGSSGAVHALFDLDGRETGPFPSDIFTVADPRHMTGRRVNLPYPDCSVLVSDCEDLDVINTLDGFGLQPRVSIPF